MKLHYLFQGLCLFKAIEAQTQQEQGKALCESLNEQLKTLQSGHKFKFLCGKTGVTPSKLDLPSESETPEECAQICAANDECKGAAWDWKFNSCQLYTSGDDLQARRTAIFVRREEVTDPKALCESMNEEIKTLAGGQKFKYICGKTGTTPSKLDLPSESETAEECAEICAANDECKGAAWDWKFKSCQLYTSGDDLQARRNAIFLRREVESGSADCTAVEEELQECEKAENDLQESLDKCQIAKTESEQAHATMAENLEACEFERDLCVEGQGSAEKCEVENSQIRDLTEELQQCNTAAVSNAAELEQCQSASSACDFDLQQCQNSASSGALELQQCQSASSSCALELQQSQAAASSNANQLQQCQNAASATTIQLQQCQNTASSSALELQQCKTNAASSVQELQQCKANAAASAGVPAFKECNAGGDGQVVKIGNRSFKQKCNVSMWKHLMPLRRVVRPGLTRQECAMICAMDGGCQSVYFVRSTLTIGECQLQTQNIESRLNRGNADIAFIPV